MGKTKIAWADYTFNGWVGCTKVSPGCQHCYAESYDKRVGGVPKSGGQLRWGVGAPRTKTSEAYWRQPLRWAKEATAAGVRPRVFCSSLADWLDPEVPDSWRLELLDLIARTPELDWLLLSKRPEQWRGALGRAIDVWPTTPGGAAGEVLAQAWLDGKPPRNVWLGVTVEDQFRADVRIPLLLETPAAVRFLSCEPLLEPVDLSAFMGGPYVGLPGDVVHDHYNAGIDWSIIGGESGPKARPFNIAWARDLVRQGRAGGAQVFVKQLGANFFMSPRVRVPLKARAGEDPAEWPEDLRVREFPEVMP